MRTGERVRLEGLGVGERWRDIKTTDEGVRIAHDRTEGLVGEFCHWRDFWREGIWEVGEKREEGRLEYRVEEGVGVVGGGRRRRRR